MPQRLFIDATPLATDRLSGIGHLVRDSIKCILEHPEVKSGRLIPTLVAPFDTLERIKLYKLQGVHYRSIPVPDKVFRALQRYDLLPPVDLILGRGIYLFMNFKNWRLVRSSSATYVHDLSFLTYPESVEPKNRRFLSRNIAKWVARTDMVIAISNYGKREIIDRLKVSQEKVIVVSPPIDGLHFYQRPTLEVSMVRKKIGLPAKYILTIGTLEPRKNHIRLIEAYGQLSKELTDKYPLVLIGGGGWLNEGIMEAIQSARAKSLNIITPKNYIADDDIPAIITGATVLVHPALYEGFGLPVLEAMACGTPVVTSNNSSLPEVGGDAVVYVDAESTQSIVTGLKNVLESKKEQLKMRESGLARAAELAKGDIGQLVNQLKRLYNK